MSYNPDASRGVYVNTLENNNVSVLHSAYGNLNLIALSKAPQDCCHDFSVAGLTERWKHFWDVKICLLWLQPDEEKWADIIQWFEKRGNMNSYDSLHSIWSRVSIEVKAMEGAARQCQQQHMANWSLGIEAWSPWEWISASMESFGSKEKWTPGKVEYAWHHGVSTLFPDIIIVCGPLPPHPPVLDVKADAGGKQFR